MREAAHLSTRGLKQRSPDPLPEHRAMPARRGRARQATFLRGVGGMHALLSRLKARLRLQRSQGCVVAGGRVSVQLPTLSPPFFFYALVPQRS